MPLPLTPERGLIFRISHVANLAWMLENGVCCPSSGSYDPNHRNIGNLELISKRASRLVPIQPGGTLNDYVPFYFTSRSPMLYNIRTGMNVASVPMREIMILVTSLPTLAAADVPFIYTDRHAYLAHAEFSSDLSDLPRLIDWDILRRSDFKHDPQDPGKMERYQAEALVHRQLPFEHLLSILVYDDECRERLTGLIVAADYQTVVKVDRGYFFG